MEQAFQKYSKLKVKLKGERREEWNTPLSKIHISTKVLTQKLKFGKLP